ncbi:MAG: 30S ribosomal protein S18 [bacterium]
MVFKTKKVCRFCINSDMPLSYKNPEVLTNYVTDKGKIIPRRITGVCARHQRDISREIKRARTIALLPFTAL